MSTSTLTKSPLQNFEFTKRKRWTETLFSEVSETILLIVSSTCKVLYCGSAIVELLGWKEDQLVDADISLFIEDEDQENFRWSFTQSLHSGQDLFVYARFKYDQAPSLDANAKPGMLFEIKGHAHFLHGQQQPPCFFLSAMPYPSRDIALLNTFLDLKIENEKLSQRIHELKKSITNPPLTSELSLFFPTTQYSQRFNQPTGPLVPNHSSLHLRTTPCPPLYTSPDSSGSGSCMNQNSSLSRLDMISPASGLPLLGNDDSEEFQRKKKLKKTFGSEEQRVCVTCGRTDSPEWRKGPHGPKTLCNACGLRWAKRTRKTEPDSDTGAHVQSSNSQLDGDPGPKHDPVGLVNIDGQQLMF